MFYLHLGLRLYVCKVVGILTGKVLDSNSHCICLCCGGLLAKYAVYIVCVYVHINFANHLM